MRIFIYRHGHKQEPNDPNDFKSRKERGLSEEGIDQITRLGKYLKKDYLELAKMQFMFSSPFPRAYQSAEIVRNILGIKEVRTMQELEEYFPYKIYNPNKNKRLEMWEKSVKNPFWKSPETRNSPDDFVKRLEKKLKKLLNDDVKNVLLSSHGFLIKNFLFKINPELKPESFDKVASFINESALNIIDFDGKNFKVIDYNICDHLK